MFPKYYGDAVATSYFLSFSFLFCNDNMQPEDRDTALYSHYYVSDENDNLTSPYASIIYIYILTFIYLCILILISYIYVHVLTFTFDTTYELIKILPI